MTLYTHGTTGKKGKRGKKQGGFAVPAKHFASTQSKRRRAAKRAGTTKKKPTRKR